MTFEGMYMLALTIVSKCSHDGDENKRMYTTLDYVGITSHHITSTYMYGPFSLKRIEVTGVFKKKNDMAIT